MKVKIYQLLTSLNKRQVEILIIRCAIWQKLQEFERYDQKSKEEYYLTRNNIMLKIIYLYSVLKLNQ